MRFKNARFRNNVVLGMIVFIICLMLMPELSLAASKLKKPVISSAKASGKNIVIKWSKVSGATKYQVYIKKDSGSYKLVTATKSVKYTYKNSYYNHTYTVKVRAVKGKKKSTFSKAKTVALVKVPEQARIQYVKETTSKLNLKWYTSTGANKYQVRIKQEGSSWKIVKTLSSTKKTYTYTKPDKSAIYYIQVRGVNKTSIGTAYGKYSVVYSTEKIQPVVTTDANKVTVTWNKITGCSEYRVAYGKSHLKYAITTKKNTISFTGKYCTEYILRVYGFSGSAKTYSDYIYFDTGSNPNLNYKRICSLPSYEGYTTHNYFVNSLGGICFDGNDLYYIKSRSEGGTGTGYNSMILGCIADFDTYTDTQNPPTTIKEIRYSDGTLYYGDYSQVDGSYGSSISYVAPYFYIVTFGSYKHSDAYTIKVSKDGIVLDEIYNSGFSALSYFGTNTSGKLQFISRTEDGIGQHKFSTEILSDSLFSDGTTYLTKEIFTMTNGNGSIPHYSDIYYDLNNKILYQAISVYDDDDSFSQDFSKNWIYSFDMSNQDSMEIDNYMYVIPTKSVTKCNLSTTKSSETQFEVEGIAVYDDKVYLGVNTEGVEDALYMIK